MISRHFLAWIFGNAPMGHYSYLHEPGHPKFKEFKGTKVMKRGRSPLCTPIIEPRQPNLVRSLLISCCFVSAHYISALHRVVCWSPPVVYVLFFSFQILGILPACCHFEPQRSGSPRPKQLSGLRLDNQRRAYPALSWGFFSCLEHLSILVDDLSIMYVFITWQFCSNVIFFLLLLFLLLFSNRQVRLKQMEMENNPHNREYIQWRRINERALWMTNSHSNLVLRV